jgi:hypothetical protein
MQGTPVTCASVIARRTVRGGSEDVVRVEACDRAASPNCATAELFFTVEGANVAAGEALSFPTAMEGDPTKPLEVHNLPPQSPYLRRGRLRGPSLRQRPERRLRLDVGFH